MAVDSRAAVGLIVGIFITALLGAFLFPVAIGAMTGAEETTINQTVSESTEVQPNLNVTLDSVTAGTSATYTVNASGSTATTTVNVGANDTVTVDGADVTLNPTEVTSTYAVTNVEYPRTYGWGGGAGALWAILPVMLVLALFLYFTYKAVGTM